MLCENILDPHRTPKIHAGVEKISHYGTVRPIVAPILVGSDDFYWMS